MARFVLVGSVVALLAIPVARADASEPLGLQRVIEMARSRAPRVRLAEAETDVARGRLVGARVLVPDNPSIEGGAGSRWGDERTTDREIALSVPLEIAGQRGKRIAEAEAVVERERHSADDARRAAVGAAARAYFRALYSDRLVALADDRVALARQLLETTRERKRSGDVAEFEVNLAEAELSRAKSGVSAARSVRARARSRLAQALGLESSVGLRVRGALDDRSLVETIERTAADRRADVLAARADLQAADAAVALADTEKYPELSLRVGYAHEERADIVFGAVSVTLPIFERGQGRRASARARRRRAAIAVEQRADRATVQVEGARAAYRAAVDAVADMEEQAVPLAIENEEMARESYAAGKLDLAALLVVRRDALDTRRAHLDRVLQAALAAVDLWVAAGAPVPR